MKIPNSHKFLLISISVLVTGFYLFFINLSSDTIILFLANKLFLGNWLRQGVFPLHNPYIFGGVPFAFDPGLGNLHPFNLMFLFPHPFSFALWAGFVTTLFLFGFYLFFSQFTKSKYFTLLLVLILFFSGSGFWRFSNPTILAVIAHYGWFLYSLRNLKKSGWKSFLMPLLSGFMMTISGHLQFVLYGYLLGLIVVLFFYKVDWKKVILYFFILGVVTSWYFALSMPIALSSTRITVSKDYTDIGPVRIPQFAQLILPFIMGQVQTGAAWNAGPTGVVLVSILFTVFMGYLVVRRKLSKTELVLSLALLVISMGVVNIPFFRGAGQVFIIIHILGLLIIARNEAIILELFEDKKLHKVFLAIAGLSVLAAIFFYLPFFSQLFAMLYSAVKKGPPNLFFDQPTVKAIGQLAGNSFLLLALAFISLRLASRFHKSAIAVLLLYVIVEGVAINYAHNYFIPRSVIPLETALPARWDRMNYRVVTAADVVPYFGFHTYMSDLLFRPPFSKEKPLVDAKEERTHEYLKKIFTYVPSSWAMVQGIKTIQGYNTFVPAKVAKKFSSPSANYEQDYAYIIARNPLFKTNDKGTQINAIETSRITLTDQRWRDLSARYYISDRKLSKYTLTNMDHRLFYEDYKAEPIYSLQIAKNRRPFFPVKENPNRIEFAIPPEYVEYTLRVKINPDGFVVKQNGKLIPVVRHDFELEIPLNEYGPLEIYYSPVFHLQQVLKLAKI